ncbi:hypothetical protein [Xenorhabdus bovienii]|uniref:Phosphoribosyltransferase domain-containing protein n=1 Tax=Xenorhabdus bovienii str. feltiae Moldova TaxID=1398200 RepID=A0A077NVG3_XENBV|nr:hypothetical protein [Xenorhabdus bovienii]CDH01596.1 conserved hypothetical protein [Xenorhabdus bovienii str. feltiae Moldova]
MTYRLTQIDELTRNRHHHLTSDDVCLYYGEYTAGGGYAHSETNQLIWNLKKSVQATARELHYKQIAISQVAKIVSEMDIIKTVTFVPVPPSKCETHSEHDNRMIAILEKSKLINPDLDYRKLITQKDNMTASHGTQDKPRPSPDEIAANYIFDSSLIDGIRPLVVVFDDVLTAGSHYKAMKTVIKQHLPDIQIIGLFVARTVRKEKYDIDNSDDDDENFLRDFDHFSHY